MLNQHRHLLCFLVKQKIQPMGGFIARRAEQEVAPQNWANAKIYYKFLQCLPAYTYSSWVSGIVQLIFRNKILSSIVKMYFKCLDIITGCAPTH